MFNRSLNRLSLTSDIADEMFPNIYGDSLSGDMSFIATLRALVSSRMSEKDTLCLRITNQTYRESFFRGHTDRENILRLTEDIDIDTISIYGFSGSEDTVNSFNNLLDSAFTQVYPEFVELGDLRMFVKKQANMRFYIDENHKSVVVFVENLNLRLYHYIQSLTSRLLPWYFKDNPLTEEERNLAKSLILKTSTNYYTLIEEFAAKYDFRSKKIEKILKGFEKIAKNRRLDTVKSNIRYNDQNIARNIEDYRRYIRERDRLLTEQAGLIALINAVDNDSEMADYFICNKHLDPIRVSDTSLEFIVNCYLENYDPEMYERISQNFDGYMYTDYSISNNVFSPVETRKKLMDAIFGDEPLLKVKVCAFYRIDLSGYVDTESGYDYPSEYADRIPNPHLQMHSCLGQQRPLIEECLREGNNIGAVEQCICSAKSINVGESATFPHLLKSLFSSGCKKVIELPDGTSCTPTEALEWLISNENTTEVTDNG